MDEIAQFYQYPYYQTPPPPPPPVPPPPPPGTTLHSLPPVVVQPLPIPQYHHPHHPSAPPLYPQDSHDDVRTLFIAGLPEDVKPREIYNLFREFAGYESSHLRSQTSSNSQPFAFAVFADQHSALMAMYELNGMVFDFEKDSKLYIELAKSNSRSKRLRPDDGRPVSEKRIKGSAAISRDGVTVVLVLAAFTCLEWVILLTTQLVIHLHKVGESLMVEVGIKLLLKRQLIHVQHSSLLIWAKVVLSKS
ncbi:hypothetical protein AABB24_025061 [Solanum stoloniferum]|uniref:RRM domain-containing protein n=1 Tax=Solanum stoloniferum TaxID=62892 RepID=A0ABD2SR89_9SOLN